MIYYKILKVAFIAFFMVSSFAWAGDHTTHSKALTKGAISYDKKEGKPKIYIEGVRLDMDYMRRNMRFVDFVNDPAVADIQIIITDRISGSGGRIYSLMYNNKTFENFGDFTLSAITASSDTDDEVRTKLKDALSLGLMPFVNETEASNAMVLRYRAKDENTQVLNEDDPWNHWTFRGDINGSIDLEESRNSAYYSFNLRADRVTEEWKIRNNARRSVRTRKYTNNDVEYKSDNTSTYVTSSGVKSLSTRWSTGLFGSYYNSNYSNMVYSISVKPAIEYNIFPWDVSDRKVFTIAYYIGPEWKKYYEETIYDKFQESLWEQTLRLDLQLVHTWGEIEAGLNATNLMHDWSKNRITFDTDLSVRIMRGLSVNFGFRVENIHDQIYLPKGEVSLEDILLNKVKLPSTFELEADFGVRVQFGSIYNNIVNNRL